MSCLLRFGRFVSKSSRMECHTSLDYLRSSKRPGELNRENYSTLLTDQHSLSDSTMYEILNKHIRGFSAIGLNDSRKQLSPLSFRDSINCCRPYAIGEDSKEITAKKPYITNEKIIHALKEDKTSPISLSSSSMTSTSEGRQEIIMLNETNFERELGKYRVAVVMFHAPWCQFCQDMKPLFSRLAQEVPSDLARLAMLDGEEYPNTALDQDVHVFPTIKLYRLGKFIADYDGPSEYSDLLQFIKSKSVN